jgi:hypothetical protein
MTYQRGDVAKWQGKGLQNPDRGFESRRRLSSSHPAQAKAGHGRPDNLKSPRRDAARLFCLPD